MNENFVTHLIPKNPDGACGGNLVGPEPHRGDARRHPEDEHLSHGARHLTQKGDGEKVGPGAGHFDPRAGTVEGRGRERHNTQPLLVQKPRDGEDERDVGEHVDHGHPIYGEGVDVIELHENVVNDAVLDPLIRVTK